MAHREAVLRSAISLIVLALAGNLGTSGIVPVLAFARAGVVPVQASQDQARRTDAATERSTARQGQSEFSGSSFVNASNANASLTGRTPAGTPASAPASGPQKQSNGGNGGFRVKSDVNLVLVEITVRDEQGGVVGDLKQHDFQVLEDGVEQQIRYFSRDELPLAVALVVDCSGSMGPVLKQLHHTAYGTLSALKADDQVALFDFAARTEQVVALTTDWRRIAEGIASIHAGGATVITDALYESALYLAGAAPGRRHVIILVSDNENTLQGYSNEKRVIREALQSQAVIYSIRVQEGLHPHMMHVLLPIFRDVSVPAITRDSGGEIIDAQNVRSVGAAMEAVISRLKQRYTLGYYSTNHRHDGAFRQIQIRVNDTSNRKLSIYARRGYYTRTQPTLSLDEVP